MDFVFDDGGRAAAGFKGKTGDCGVRAIAIATGLPYREVYDLVGKFCAGEKPSKSRRGKSHPRTGVHKHTFKEVMRHLGWNWTPTMQIGSGCRVHLRKDELPTGRVIAGVSRHYVAVVDGVVRDIYDCTRDGDRCVYGYYTKASI